jgi:hypothetical protein
MNYNYFNQMPRSLRLAMMGNIALRRYFDELCAIKVWF